MNWKTFLAVLTILIPGGYALLELGLNKHYDYLERQDKYQQIRDSLYVYEKSQRALRSFDYAEKINVRLDALQEKHPCINRVVVFKVHDHGESLSTTEPKYVTILFEEQRYDVEPIREEWQAKLLPTGFIRYCANITVTGTFYLPDVMVFPTIYSSKTRYHLDKGGTLALYGISMGKNDDGSEVYFMSVSFNETTPNLNHPIVLDEIDEAAAYVKNYLQP